MGDHRYAKESALELRQTGGLLTMDAAPCWLPCLPGDDDVSATTSMLMGLVKLTRTRLTALLTSHALTTMAMMAGRALTRVPSLPVRWRVLAVL